MSKIETIVADYESVLALSRKNVEDVPFNVRAGWGGRIQDAQQALPGLRAELLKSTIPDRLVGVFASGDAAKVALAVTCISENGGIVLDAGKLYTDLALDLELSYGQDREFRTSQFGLLMQEYATLARHYGYDTASALTFRGKVCSTVQASAAHIRTLVRGAIKDELNIQALKDVVLDTVVKHNLVGAQVPVLVVNAPAEEQAVLASFFCRSSTYEFDATFEVTQPALLKVFKGEAGIKPAIKNKRKTNEETNEKAE